MLTHFECSSNIRNKAAAILDFPAPVRPTIPSFSPLLQENVIPCNTSGNPDLQIYRSRLKRKSIHNLILDLQASIPISHFNIFEV